MRAIWIGVALALCALLLSTGSVLADIDVPKNDVSRGDADVMRPKMGDDMEMEMPVKERAPEKEEGMVNDKDVVMKDSSAKDNELMEDDDLNDMQNTEKMKKMGQMSENENDEKLASEEDAKILAQPGMRRLARYLRNFHGRQIFHANSNAIAAQRAAAVVSDEDEDAIAEERAVRRRKRIRRRNTKNKVKRRHNNRHVANRRKVSRRNSNNRSSTRRRNSNRSSSNKRQRNRKNSRVRRVNPNRLSRGRSGPRLASVYNGRIIRRGTRQNSNQKSSKQKKMKNRKSKNGKKQKKNRKQKKPKRPDTSSGRKDDNQNANANAPDAEAEAHREPQNAAESPAA